MIFLRRARHVASIVTLSLAAGSYAWAQSPRQEQGRDAKPQSNGPALAVPAPPAQEVTVAVVETAEPDQQPWYRKEWALWVGEKFWDIEWGNWAVLGAAIWAGRLALRTLRTQTTQIQLGRQALGANRKAADAAREAADTANKSFMAGSAVVMSISDLQVARLTKITTGEVMVRAQYRIHNASKNAALVEAWGGTILLPDEMSGTDIELEINETFAPGKGLHFPLDAGPLQPQHFTAWDKNSLVLRVELWVRVVDPQGRTTTQQFKRLVICGVTAKPQSMLWSGGHDA